MEVDMAKKVTTAEKPAEHDAGIPAQIKNPKEREAWEKELSRSDFKKSAPHFSQASSEKVRFIQDSIAASSKRSNKHHNRMVFFFFHTRNYKIIVY
jgi:hypothetical protein